MLAKYQRFTLGEREEISLDLAQRYSLRALVQMLKHSPSTFSRKVSRNRTCTDYRAMQAQHEAAKRQFRKPPKLASSARLRQYVFHSLGQHWSPVQISIRLKLTYRDDESMRISPETIYTYLYVLSRAERYAENCWAVCANTTRHDVHAAEDRTDRDRSPKCSVAMSTPPEVADRTVPGHWEGDLIMGAGNRTALSMLVERTTRGTLLIALKARPQDGCCLLYAPAEPVGARHQ